MSSRVIYSATDRGAIDDNPCRYCTAEDGRTENCHAECWEYFFWELRQENRREESWHESEAQMDYIGYKRDILPEYHRKNRRK